MKNGNIIIIAVTLMDFLTAILILTDPNQLLVARLGIFYQIFPSHASFYGGVLMLFSVACVIYALVRPIKTSFRRFLLFIPQQLFLFASLCSAIDYIILQHYADGVLRPWPFIFQDQLPSIVLAIGYFFGILSFEKKQKLP